VSKSQRNKGAGGEREVCEIFNAALNRDDIKRNIGQSRDGGNDIDVGPLVVEVKRRKTLGTIYGWMQQAIEAVKGRRLTGQQNVRSVNLPPGSAGIVATIESSPLLPVVVFRQDGDTSWMVMMRLNDWLKFGVRDELMAFFEEEK